ncbi:MAG TPA: hypothetical protein PLL22_06360, partial [Microbacteriaceae bacterium]|nr:hypothetical protein [Microbacteriaceae bacterium]
VLFAAVLFAAVLFAAVLLASALLAPVLFAVGRGVAVAAVAAGFADTADADAPEAAGFGRAVDARGAGRLAPGFAGDGFGFAGVGFGLAGAAAPGSAGRWAEASTFTDLGSEAFESASGSCGTGGETGTVLR